MPLSLIRFRKADFIQAFSIQYKSHYTVFPSVVKGFPLFSQAG